MSMSASAMSAMIRAKKKKMMEEDSAMTESGIPMDAQDIAINKNHEYGEHLSENKPKDHEEEPTIDELIAADTAPQPHEEMAPDPMEMDEKMKRQMKIKSMMMRMK